MVILPFVRSDDAPVLLVHDSFIVHHAFDEKGELDGAKRWSFHDSVTKDIKVSEDMVGILLSSFDGIEAQDLPKGKIVTGPSENSQ